MELGRVAPASAAVMKGLDYARPGPATAPEKPAVAAQPRLAFEHGPALRSCGAPMMIHRSRFPLRFKVVRPSSRSRASKRIYGAVPASPARSEGEGDLGRLVMDLSAMGIPSTEKTFALRVEGDSMSGAGINDGDVLILEKREPRSGEIVVALLEHQVTLKRYIVEGDKVLLRAENPQYEDIIPDEGGLKIQGVAVGLIRKL